MYCKSGTHLNMGGENYETEIAEAIFAVSEAENHVELANS